MLVRNHAVSVLEYPPPAPSSGSLPSAAFVAVAILLLVASLILLFSPARPRWFIGDNRRVSAIAPAGNNLFVDGKRCAMAILLILSDRFHGPATSCR
jgi:hypothetical protein